MISGEPCVSTGSCWALGGLQAWLWMPLFPQCSSLVGFPQVPPALTEGFRRQLQGQGLGHAAVGPLVPSRGPGAWTASPYSPCWDSPNSWGLFLSLSRKMVFSLSSSHLHCLTIPLAWPTGPLPRLSQGPHPGPREESNPQKLMPKVVQVLLPPRPVCELPRAPWWTVHLSPKAMLTRKALGSAGSGP